LGLGGRLPARHRLNLVRPDVEAGAPLAISALVVADVQATDHQHPRPFGQTLYELRLAASHPNTEPFRVLLSLAIRPGAHLVDRHAHRGELRALPRIAHFRSR